MITGTEVRGGEESSQDEGKREVMCRRRQEKFQRAAALRSTDSSFVPSFPSSDK